MRERYELIDGVPPVKGPPACARRTRCARLEAAIERRLVPVTSLFVGGFVALRYL